MQGASLYWGRTLLFCQEEENKVANSKKSTGNIGGKLGVAAGVIGAVGPIAIDILDRLPKKDETNAPDNHILMPELCSKKFPLKLSEAKELLEGRGLKILPIEVRVRDAGVKYKDCFEFQVVGSDRKANAKLKLGEVVIVQYVTREVIDESRRIFDEAEEQKAALKEARAVKRAEQMEQAKIAAADAAGKVRDGFGKMARRDGKKKKEHRKEIPNEQE